MKSQNCDTTVLTNHNTNERTGFVGRYAVAHTGVACGVVVADPGADPRAVTEVGVCHRIRHRASG